jgi:hypothetical protein
MAAEKMYYRVLDTQTDSYFATGYNSTSLQELIESFRSYIETGNDAPESMDVFQTWDDIADWLQGSILESSKHKFENQSW